jgi:two-component system sensor histidine kinase UhpB
LGLAISNIKRRLPFASEPVSTELDRVGGHIRDLTVQIRQLSHQLHPEILDHVGLVKALESYVLEFGNEEQITINYSAEVTTSPIRQEVAVCVYRTALRLYARPGIRATTANVTLKETDGSGTKGR